MSLPEILTAFTDIRTSLGGLRPEAVLLTGLVLTIVGGWSPRTARFLPVLTLLTLASAGAALWTLPDASPFFQQMLLTDAPARTAGALVLLSGGLAVTGFGLIPSGSSSPKTTPVTPPAFLLALMLGGLLLTRAVHGIVLVLAIELLSLPSYGLVLTRRRDPAAARAALTYVLLGAVATGALLYGLSVLYGLTGTLHLADPVFWQRLAVAPMAPLIVALALVVAGLLFKLGAAPLHFWVPDAYAAAPLPVALLLSTAPKVAAAVALWRLQASAATLLPGLQANAMALLLTGAALLSLALGTLGALSQPNVRRLLGYSSVAQAGFLLLAIRASAVGGPLPVLLYAAFLVLANGATFLAIGGFETLHPAGAAAEASAYAGLGRRFPLLATALTVGMVALTGLPPTVGFSAKLVAFTTLWQADATPAGRVLLVAGVLLTVASLYFYLRVPYWLFLKEAPAEADSGSAQRPTALTWCAVVLAGLLVAAFVKADWVMLG
jgi:NADH-quinone oxidoreductase subunit N